MAGADVESQDLAALYRGPAGTSRIFVEALVAGDVGAAARCFDPRASILTADGTEVSGAAGIAEILGQIAASRVRLRIRRGRTLRAGPVAMTTQIWDREISGSADSSTARLVLHESAGRWSILIAALWGSG